MDALDRQAGAARVRVDFACNDPDSGRWLGRVSAIEIHGRYPVLELETTGGDRVFHVERGRFRLSGKWFGHLGGRTWVGNWCWDGLTMTIVEAARLLGWLHQRKLFDATAGESVLFDQWQEERRFGGPHLLRQLTIAGQEQGL